MVIRIRQRRRQRKLSGHNAYFESLKQPTPTAPAPTTSTPTVPTTTSTKTSEASKQTTTRSFSAASSHLDNMTTAAKTPTSSTKKAPPQVVPKKNGLRLSGASSYLDNLSSPSMTESQRRITVISKKKSDDAKKLDEKPSKQPTFAPPGKGTSYLESLSASAASSDRKKTKEEKVKAKQSGAISNNPFLEEVRGWLVFNFYILFLKILHILL